MAHPLLHNDTSAGGNRDYDSLRTLLRVGPKDNLTRNALTVLVGIRFPDFFDCPSDIRSRCSTVGDHGAAGLQEQQQ
jgi:hypothetical protein